jgi:putative transposase
MVILSFGISMRPTLELALKPLEEAIEIVKDSKFRTTLHSDQGWHYQHDKWVKMLKENKVFQSMSRKGNCLDNSPMENFFGLLKQEMYYGEALCTFEELKKRIEEYKIYYNNKRRVADLGIKEANNCSCKWNMRDISNTAITPNTVPLITPMQIFL